MPKSLLEQLPEIVANGRKEAEKILEGLESRHRVSLQTREVVLPAKDSAVQDWVTAQNRQAQHATQDDAWTNRLIYGDNLLAMAALLAGDENTPSLRGKVDLFLAYPVDCQSCCRMNPFTAVERLIGGCRSMRREAQCRVKRGHWVEAPIEAKHKFVEVRL